VLCELIGLWLFTLLAIRGVVTLQGTTGTPEFVLAVVPCLFIYMPVWLCRLRKTDSYAYRLSIPAFRDRTAWSRALREAGVVLAIVGMPWFIGYHLYQTLFFGFEPGLVMPAEPLTLIAYQLFFVAIPEEFFYRGYMQTRLNEVFERRFLLFGIPFSHSLWITSLLFAFGHSLVVLRWWHFATFFPGLLFGLLRERTGGVMAGAFFHAACNILVVWLDTVYGVIPP
jgi:uncharacterized protein